MRHVYQFPVNEFANLQKELASAGVSLAGPDDPSSEYMHVHKGVDVVTIGVMDYRGGQLADLPDGSFTREPFYTLKLFHFFEDEIPPDLTEEIGRLLAKYDK